MFTKIKNMVKGADRYAHMYKIHQSSKFVHERMYGELLRNVHTIEKGLSLEHIREGFGYEKIMAGVSIAQSLIPCNEKSYNEAIDMFISALNAYLKYHETIRFSSEKTDQIRAAFEALKAERKLTENSLQTGGTLHVRPTAFNNYEETAIIKLFESRHSVRAFSGVPVPHEKIIDAIRLAHHCPSACNRQGYRVHIIDKNGFEILGNWFEGVGGFKQDIDKMLFITGKQSVYRIGEELQYIVSSSVFAGYLTLALQVYGVGCCFIQRPVVYSQEWAKIAKALNIPEDEQIVCALGIGMLKPEFNVPVSHRIDLDTIVTFH